MAKILIVDDIAVNRDLLTAILAHKGYEILEASDGAEALEMLTGRHYSLLITDIKMPRLSGVPSTS